ncbi:C81 [Sulfolobus spindle-shaped virus Lassen]|nr:C81 [Sulfolobus spindle-shaped virus Lassen]
MTDAISLALQTGLGPVIAVIIIIAMMGLTYKMAGKIPAIITGIASTFALMFLNFLPIFWGIAVIFGLIAGMVLTGGDRDGY